MSSTVKTAISIDSGIYRKVESLSRKLHISKSRFFTQAAQYMIEKNDNLELLKKINAACTDADSEEGRLKREKNYAKKQMTEKW